MKTFSVLILLSGCLFFSAQAQEHHQYVPNARQAVQKSRMQQSQYFELTNHQVNNTQAAWTFFHQLPYKRQNAFCTRSYLLRI